MLKRNEIARYNNSHHDIYAHPLNFLELIWWSGNTSKIKANNLLFYASIYATKSGTEVCIPYTVFRDARVGDANLGSS